MNAQVKAYKGNNLQNEYKIKAGIFSYRINVFIKCYNLLYSRKILLLIHNHKKVGVICCKIIRIKYIQIRYDVLSTPT